MALLLTIAILTSFSAAVSQNLEDQFFIVHRFLHTKNLTKVGTDLSEDLRSRIQALETLPELGLPTEKSLKYNSLVDFQRAVGNTDGYVHSMAYDTLMSVERIHNATMLKWLSNLEKSNDFFSRPSGFAQDQGQAGAFNATNRQRTYDHKIEDFSWKGFAANLATIVVVPSSYKAKKVKKQLQQLDRQSSYTFAASVINSQVMMVMAKAIEVDHSLQTFADGILDNNDENLNQDIMPMDELATVIGKIDQYLEKKDMQCSISVNDGYKGAIKVKRSWAVLDEILDISIMVPVKNKTSSKETTASKAPEAQPSIKMDLMEVVLFASIGGIQVVFTIFLFVALRKIHNLSATIKKKSFDLKLELANLQNHDHV